MEVAAGVHRLTKGIVNWYLIEDGGKLVLVDAGAPGDWDLLVLTVASSARARYLRMYRTLFSLARRGAARMVPIRELSGFSDGEVLDVPGQPRVLHAPGHTDGTAALNLESRGVLFTGDALVTRNPLTGRVGPQIMPSGFNRDTPAALSSLGNLDRVAADIVLPGHGEPWTHGVSEAVRAAREAGTS